VCVCVGGGVCGIIVTERMLELADSHARRKTYRCEVCKGASDCVLYIRGTCKVQSTQLFVIQFCVCGCVSCHVVSCWAYTALPKLTLLRGPGHV
jgi:hypothetical protein